MVVSIHGICPLVFVGKPIPPGFMKRGKLDSTAILYSFSNVENSLPKVAESAIVDSKSIKIIGFFSINWRAFHDETPAVHTGDR